MVNLLIVDDETVICESMKLKIGAIGNPSIREVFIAHSGADALAILNTTEIHIVITDIKMPGMSGIELMKAVGKKDPPTKWIVLSGYDDYSYVREAFMLGAMDYLLKPATSEELKEKIKHALDKIIEEQALLANGQMALIKQECEILKAHVTGEMAGNEPDERQHDIIRNILRHQYVCLAIVDFEMEDEVAIYSQRVRLEQIWTREFDLLKGRDNLLLYSFWIENGQLAFVCNFDEPVFPRALHDIFEHYLSVAGQASDAYAMMAISQVFDDKSRLNAQFRRVVTALKYRLLCPPYSIIHTEMVEREKAAKPILNTAQVHSISGEDMMENIKQISHLISDLLTSDKLAGHSIDDIEQLYHQISGRLRHMHESLLHTNEGIAYKDVSDFKSIQSMKAYLFEQIFHIKKMAMSHSNRDRTIGEIARNYIRENMQKEIDMSVVSNMVSVNYTYFSELFKKQTGLTFRGYIAKVRMEEAKRLLSDPTWKIKEIAARVGYDNPKHFTRAFVNYYGVSPTDLRHERAAGEE